MKLLPNLSLAAKLYAILALLATVTVVLAAVAGVNASGNPSITADLVWTLSVLTVVATVLAAVGAVVIGRAVARPLRAIAQVTEAAAGGTTQIAIPYGERRDEIGALARSIGILQDAMRRNEDLNRTMAEGAEARTRRQEGITTEVSQFGSEVETTLAELGRIAEQALSASASLAGAAEQASTRTGGAQA